MHFELSHTCTEVAKSVIDLTQASRLKGISVLATLDWGLILPCAASESIACLRGVRKLPLVRRAHNPIQLQRKYTDIFRRTLELFRLPDASIQTADTALLFVTLTTRRAGVQICKERHRESSIAAGRTRTVRESGAQAYKNHTLGIGFPRPTRQTLRIASQANSLVDRRQTFSDLAINRTRDQGSHLAIGPRDGIACQMTAEPRDPTAH
jgi:hypothetical protein